MSDATSVETGVSLGPLHLPNPIVTASGTFGHGAEVARFEDASRLGAVTAKSVSAEPWAGKPAPRLHMTASGMLNAVGLQGPGVSAWVEHDLPALRAAGARVIASIWGRTVDEFARAATMLRDALADVVALEVNVSCPNLHRRSEMFAHDPDATSAVVRAVVEVGLGLPVFVKLSPNVTDLTEIAHAAVGAGADGLTLVNTLMGLLVDAEARRPVLGGGGGGLSGPAIKPVALRAVHDVTRALPGVPVIGTGGVQSGTDAVEMLLAGASAVGIGTANFFDPRAPYRVLDELVAWCARHDVTCVGDLIGAMEDVP
ncbi:MAG TPA: dihydroorotate dehydrogenase [Acidimicrobiia bacterium]|nr:dihydroorotate dehydrogenase [Acidimicrobiia bacterium]